MEIKAWKCIISRWFFKQNWNYIGPHQNRYSTTLNKRNQQLWRAGACKDIWLISSFLIIRIKDVCNIQMLLRLTATIAQVREFYSTFLENYGFGWKYFGLLAVRKILLSLSKYSWEIISVGRLGISFLPSSYTPDDPLTKKAGCRNRLSVHNGLGGHNHMFLTLEEQALTIGLWFTFSSQSFKQQLKHLINSAFLLVNTRPPTALMAHDCRPLPPAYTCFAHKHILLSVAVQ